MQEVCVEPYPDLLPAQAKEGPALCAVISLLARSKPGTYSHVC